VSTTVTSIEERIRPTEAEIAAWCRSYISRVLGIAEAKIDVAAEFDSFGLDSAMAVALVSDIGAWLGDEIEPSELFEYPTIAAFAKRLAGRQ